MVQTGPAMDSQKCNTKCNKRLPFIKYKFRKMTLLIKRGWQYPCTASHKHIISHHISQYMENGIVWSSALLYSPKKHAGHFAQDPHHLAMCRCGHLPRQIERGLSTQNNQATALWLPLKMTQGLPVIRNYKILKLQFKCSSLKLTLTLKSIS